jgi:hypothetical protein
MRGERLTHITPGQLFIERSLCGPDGMACDLI